MKEKDKKTISIVCLIAGFIITLFVVQLISKQQKPFLISDGYTSVCMSITD